MNRKRLAVFALIFLVGGLGWAGAQVLASGRGMQNFQQEREETVLYFSPEVFPDVEEIKEPTNLAFFSALTDKVASLKGRKVLRVDAMMSFEEISSEIIREYCKNNGANYAVLPRVKYFKVGFGKYVFSNQVVVSMKLYDAEGSLITETEYNTYRKNMRLLGSAENSVQVGTKGAINDLAKKLRKALRKSK